MSCFIDYIKLQVPLSTGYQFTDFDVWHNTKVNALTGEFVEKGIKKDSLTNGLGFMSLNYNKDKQDNLSLILSCSPLTLSHGHNIFGYVSLKSGCENMFELLKQQKPELHGALDINNTLVTQLDIARNATIECESDRAEFIDYLYNVRIGHLKKRMKYETSVYHGYKSNERVLKTYLKREQMHELKSSMTDTQKEITSRLEHSYKNQVRFEASLKKPAILKYFNSNNMRDLGAIEQNLLSSIHSKLFSPLFDSLQSKKGKESDMRDADTVSKMIESSLCNRYVHEKKLKSKAVDIFNFYTSLVFCGYEKQKQRYEKSTFKRYVSDLLESGFSLAELQNTKGGLMHSQPKSFNLIFD